MDFSNVIYEGDAEIGASTVDVAIALSQGQIHQDDGGSSPPSPSQSAYSTDSLESFNSLTLIDIDDVSSNCSPHSNGPRPSSGDGDGGSGAGAGAGTERNMSLDSGFRSANTSCSSSGNENEVNTTRDDQRSDINGDGASPDADIGNVDNYHYNNNVNIGYNEYGYNDFQRELQQQQQQQMQTHVLLFMPQVQGAPNEYSSINVNEQRLYSSFAIKNGHDNGLFPLPPGPPPPLPLFPNQIINNATLVPTNDHNAYGGGLASFFPSIALNNGSFGGAENGYFDSTGTFIGSSSQLFQFYDQSNIAITPPPGLFNNGYPYLQGLVNEDVHIMGEEFTPGTYVSSVFDPTSLSVKGIKYNQCNYQYFVPPMVEDGDYFGGQQPIWQNRIVQSFEKFTPDVWIMKGVEEIKSLYRTYWHVFTITAKLRFCCRSCRRPWTSMRGRIVFCFNLDQMAHRGYIFMKIFGQKCVQPNCNDNTSFQVPACYPEEIHRVMWKVSEYIGYLFYNIQPTAQFFLEPDKAYRGGNPSTPHRKNVCQACSSGFCSAVKTKHNFLIPG